MAWEGSCGTGNKTSRYLHSAQEDLQTGSVWKYSSLESVLGGNLRNWK